MASLLASATPASRSRSVTHGTALTFETLDAAESGDALLRVHPTEHTLLRVLGGVLRLTSEGSERLLGPEDEAIVPAGAPHRLTAAAGQARVVLGFRAAAR